MFCTYIFNILMTSILLKRFDQLAKKLPNHMEKHVHCHVYKNSYSDYIPSQLNPENFFTPFFFRIDKINVNSSSVHKMKAYGGVNIQLLSFLTLVFGGEESVSPVVHTLAFSAIILTITSCWHLYLDLPNALNTAGFPKNFSYEFLVYLHAGI